MKKVRVSSLGDVLLKNGTHTWKVMNGLINVVPNEHMIRGTVAEKYIKEFYLATNNDIKLHSEQLELENDIVCGHIDGIVNRCDQDMLLEVKSAIRQFEVLPQNYIIQVMVYMGLLREYGHSIDKAIVVVCDGFWKIKEHIIDFDGELYETILRKTKEWYDNYIVGNVEPEPFPEEKEVIPLNSNSEIDALIEEYEFVKLQIKELQERETLIKNTLINHGTFQTLRYIVEVKDLQQKRLDTDALKKSGLDLSNYYKVVEFQQLKIKQL